MGREEIRMNWTVIGWLWWFAGLVSGVAVLELASRRGRVPDGAGIGTLVAFVFAWPALLPIALVTHVTWMLEVRRSDRQTRA